MKIVLVYHSINKYDAIATDILQEYQSLKKHGYDVVIYADKFDREYKRLIIDKKSFSAMTRHKDTVVIYHHGGYWGRANSLFASTTSNIYLKYHNVTPSDYFKNYNSDFFNYTLLGRRQTQDFVESGNIFHYLADSSYNAADLRKLGVSDSKISISPPFHNISKFDSLQPDVGVLDELLDGRINILFVGRTAPNKGHGHLVRTVERYVQYYGYNLRINIIGGIDPKLQSYYRELTDYIDHAGLNDFISFKSHIPLNELFSYYVGSHIFLLLSEHEGFCVPILEAQYHHVPIIALDRGAVRETLGDEQLIYHDVDYDILAAAIHSVASSQDFRGYLAEKGFENYQKYSLLNLEERFIDVIREKQKNL